jgi:acetylornithine deacetylase/succinyl-diaminopimelate desuccinylase-like protein
MSNIAAPFLRRVMRLRKGSLDMQRAEYLSLFEAEKGRIIDVWKELLRFPSVSNNPAHDGDCAACAKWLCGYLAHLGLKAEVLPTSGKPAVFALREGDPALPTLLYYGHYDVQPAGDLKEWSTPPFEPTLRGNRLYARGALDNKGQTIAFFAGLETAISRGLLKCPLKIIIEGEEESGSGGLSESLGRADWREKLSSDILLVSDSEAFAEGIPAITMGLRGIISLAVHLHGPRFDLHSGLHGGVAPNPAAGMAQLLASLHNPDGSIAVAGYYDSVPPVSAETQAYLAAARTDVKKYEADFGVRPEGGERGIDLEERLAFRPTIEINGLHSGYDGPGHKTIIPAKADAKITSRIVAGQNPQQCLALIEQHLRAHTPRGLTLVIDEQDARHGALCLDPNTPLIKRASAVLERAYGHKPVLGWGGASIPIMVALVQALGAKPLMVGFGLPEDRMHGPDESFSLTQLRDGYVYVCMILEELSRQ